MRKNQKTKKDAFQDINFFTNKNTDFSIKKLNCQFVDRLFVSSFASYLHDNIEAIATKYNQFNPQFIKGINIKIYRITKVQKLIKIIKREDFINSQLIEEL